jgi:drug/metabolite transporter (DMT)-like permease
MSANPASSRPTPSIAAIRRAIALQILATFLFTGMSLCVKALATYPTVQLLFFRSLLGLLPVLWVLARGSGIATLRSRRKGAHALRCAVGVLSMFAGYFALSRMPLADYIAISFAAPLYAAALSGVWLGERVGWARWSAIAIGFVGVLLMAGPTGEADPTAAIIAVFASMGYGAAILCMRDLGRTEPAVTTVFYFTFATALAAGLLLPWNWVTPDATSWALLFAIGLAGGVAQILSTEAYRRAPAAIIAPFDYTSILWALLFGLIVFGEFPLPIVLLGAVTVCASGLFILWNEGSARQASHS